MRVRVDGEHARPRGGAGPRQVQAPHDRGRRRPLRRAVSAPDGDAGGRGAADPRPRLADSIETALRLGEGVVVIAPAGGETPASRSTGTASATLPLRRHHDRRAGAADLLVQLAARRVPHLHWDRHPAEIDPDLSFPNAAGASRGGAGAVVPDGDRRLLEMKILEAIFAAHGWDVRAPIRDLPRRRSSTSSTPRREKVVIALPRTSGGENTYNATFEGIIPNLERRYRETDPSTSETELESTWSRRPCPACLGKRLRPEALGVTIGRPQHLDVSTLSGDARRSRGSGGACRTAITGARADDRPDGRSRRSPHACGSSSTSGSTTSRSTAPRRRSPAGRRSASGSPPRSARSLIGVLYILDEPSHRPAPARQRQADRHADAPARPGQHRARRGARRGDDPDRRLGRGHRPGRRRARRRGHRLRPAGGSCSPSPASITGRLPARRASRVPIPDRRARQRHGDRRPRRARAQPARTSTSRSRSGGSSRHRCVGARARVTL